MKRLVIFISLLTLALSAYCQNRPIYRDGVYYNSPYRNFKANQARRYSTQRVVQQPVQTVVVQDNSEEVEALRARMDQLEKELKRTKRHWYNKYSSGDCLIKSGHRNNACIGIGIGGAVLTGGLTYLAVSEKEDNDKKKIFTYSAIGTGSLTALLCFTLHMNSIKWKIRAGKKANMDIEFKGNELAINF